MRSSISSIALFASIAACSSSKAVQESHDGAAFQTGGTGAQTSAGDGNGGSSGAVGGGGNGGTSGIVDTGGTVGAGGREMISDASSDSSADAAQDSPGISPDGSSWPDASLACPERNPRLSSTAVTCPIELAWTSLRCTYSALSPGTTGDPCTVSFQCQCISGQGGPPTCTWSEVSEVGSDGGVPAPDSGKTSPDAEAPVSCGSSTCGDGQYCRAGCCATRGCVLGPPSCEPLPSACNGTPTCECICGRSGGLCTITSGVAVQCGCA
jgi:hypothetical protein